MHKGVIVHVNAGSDIPDEALKRFIAANSSCHGIAVAFDDGTVEMVRSEEAGGIDEVTKMRASVKDKPMILHFADYPKDWAKMDIQPFTILPAPAMEGEDGLNQSLLSAFLEGDFSLQRVEEDTIHSDAYQTVQNYLKPKIEQMFEMCGGDIGKLMEALDKPFSRKEMEALFGDRGTITLIGGNGKVLNFERNGEKGTAPWGWASRSCGYIMNGKDGEAADAPKEGTSRLGRLASALHLPGAKKEAAPVTIAPVEPIKQPAASVIEKPKASVPEVSPATAVKVPGKPKVLGKPPAGLNQSKLKKWYYKNFGPVLPEGWREGVEVELKDGSPARSFAEAGERMRQQGPAAPTAVAEPKPTPTPAKVESKPNGKDTSTKHVKADNAPLSPVLSGEVKKAIRENFISDKRIVALIDEHGHKLIADPKTFQQLEEKNPSFFEQTGTTFEQIAMWPLTVQMGLCELYPEAAGLLVKNLIAMTKKAQKELEDLKGPSVVVSDTPASGTDQVGDFLTRKRQRL